MKAILVIEMPKSCNKCQLKTHRFGFTTNKMKVGCKFKGDILTDVLSDRPSWCPLKPMPQKKKNLLNKNTTMKDFNSYCSYRDGWNDCIDTILGEEE